MKKILFFVVVLTLAFQVSALAETKIAVFRMQAVISDSDYGKEITALLKVKFEPMEKQLEREAEEIKKLEEELKNQDLALKLEAKQDKQREYRRKTRDLQDSVQAYRQKRQMEEQKYLAPLLQKISDVVSEYAKKNGYTAVFEGSQSGIAWINDDVDITPQVIEELNKLKKAGK